MVSGLFNSCKNGEWLVNDGDVCICVSFVIWALERATDTELPILFVFVANRIKVLSPFKAQGTNG
jgi:hypothetical protein